MEDYAGLCTSFGLPVWMASLLRGAKGLKSDVARRRKAYRLLQRKLRFHGLGAKTHEPVEATYVYPPEVKELIRSVFPEDVCGYPDPQHQHVVHVTLEDLHGLQTSSV